jgi:signal transduction histidine kinase
VTGFANEPLEAAPAPRRRLGWSADNPLVRAVGRIRLPLGVKLVAGYVLIAGLLAIGYLLGVVALSQSNSRGEQLLRLQRRAVGVQVVLTDATQLSNTIEYRINAPGAKKAFGSGLDQAIGNDMEQLCIDSGITCLVGAATPGPFRLAGVDPKAFRLLATSVPLFYPIGADTTAPSGSVASILRRAERFATTFTAEVSADARTTRVRANALVDANRSSFTSSRDLLLGVGATSILLAVALGLLLAWSVVVPLRRTESRLDEIATGEFARRLEVANRDEIGSLAAKVNRMSDELERVHRELETASRHKSDFLATMSHELRTPLNAIIGFSEVLQEQMFGDLNERQLAYVDDVLEAGKYLLSLINDVLDLAKIEAGRMDLELSEVAVTDVLRSAVSMYSERTSRGGVELNLTTEPEEITIAADERRLRQIVFNLLSNAVKFTPAHGRIDVSARLENDHIEIEVADTGPGIAAADLDTIFEEFEQTSEGKQAEGTGLGLPLSRKLVELHGGRLWAESTPGRGSTFHLTLPARQKTAP